MNTTRAANLLIFDSGAGGLTIAKAIHDKNPHLNITYLADTAGFPYGTLAEKDLFNRISLVFSDHLSIEPDIAVIACNTASTIVLDHLRERFDFPIVGVVPAIKPAAQRSASSVIGVLATPATIERSYTSKLIDQFASDTRVHLCGSGELVHMCENFVVSGKYDNTHLTAILHGLLDMDDSKKMDVLVLACTHFPILRKAIENIVDKWKPGVEVIDSTDAICRRVNFLLHSHDYAGLDQRGEVRIINTSNIDNSHYYRFIVNEAIF